MEIRNTNFIVQPNDVDGNNLHIRGSEGRHLAVVLRAKKGDLFYAIDGSGKRYRCFIDRIGKDGVAAQIVSVSRNINEPLVNITLGISLLKSPSMDYALEKATECGVMRIIPFVSERTIVEMPVGVGLSRKRKRWQSVIRAAVKQSLRSHIPMIEDPCLFKDIIGTERSNGHKIIADLGERSQLVRHINFSGGGNNILLLVGPEAGFTPSELEEAERSDFNIIKFCPQRLRSETAAAVFTMMLQYVIGELD